MNFSHAVAYIVKNFYRRLPFVLENKKTKKLTDKMLENFPSQNILAPKFLSCVDVYFTHTILFFACINAHISNYKAIKIDALNKNNWRLIVSKSFKITSLWVLLRSSKQAPDFCILFCYSISFLNTVIYDLHLNIIDSSFYLNKFITICCLFSGSRTNIAVSHNVCFIYGIDAIISMICICTFLCLPSFQFIFIVFSSYSSHFYFIFFSCLDDSLLS